MSEDELRQVRRGIETWARRPPVLSPGAARTRVVARITERGPRSVWRLAAAAALVAAAGTVGLLVDRGGPQPSPAPTERAAQPKRLLVYELESGTQIYYALPAVQRRGTGLLR